MDHNLVLSRVAKGRWKWTFTSSSSRDFAQGIISVKASTREGESALVKERLKKLFADMAAYK